MRERTEVNEANNYHGTKKFRHLLKFISVRFCTNFELNFLVINLHSTSKDKTYAKLCNILKGGSKPSPLSEPSRAIYLPATQTTLSSGTIPRMVGCGSGRSGRDSGVSPS